MNTMESRPNPIANLDLRQLTQCYTENHRWAGTLTNYEQESEQLTALLDDVLEHYNHQSLRQRAIEYRQRLNRLKTWFSRLRTDLVCEGSLCVPGDQQARCLHCGQPRFGLYASLSLQFADLSDEFARIKASCYQFLSGMVQLNLL